MRFALFSLVTALLAAFAMATAPLRAVIITWPNTTPDNIVSDAKQAILQASGEITYDYNFEGPKGFKGFAAKAPASALEMVSTMSDVYKCEIEEDGVVTTQNNKERSL